MGDIKRLDIVDIELNSGNLHRSWLNHSIGSGDNNANGFGVRLFRNGEPVNIGAGWVQGFFRNSQGENIALTQHGAIAGNEAYVVLPQACYNYDGPFTLAIKLVSEGSTNTVTMRIVDGMVDNTNTGSAVAPTGTVPTYQEILAVYAQMQEDVEDYESVVANQNGKIDDLKNELSSTITDLTSYGGMTVSMPLTWLDGTATTYSQGINHNSLMERCSCVPFLVPEKGAFIYYDKSIRYQSKSSFRINYYHYNNGVFEKATDYEYMVSETAFVLPQYIHYAENLWVSITYYKENYDGTLLVSTGNVSTAGTQCPFLFPVYTKVTNSELMIDIGSYSPGYFHSYARSYGCILPLMSVKRIVASPEFSLIAQIYKIDSNEQTVTVTDTLFSATIENNVEMVTGLPVIELDSYNYDGYVVVGVMKSYYYKESTRYNDGMGQLHSYNEVLDNVSIIWKGHAVVEHDGDIPAKARINIETMKHYCADTLAFSYGSWISSSRQPFPAMNDSNFLFYNGADHSNVPFMHVSLESLIAAAKNPNSRIYKQFTSAAPNSNSYGYGSVCSTMAGLISGHNGGLQTAGLFHDMFQREGFTTRTIESIEDLKVGDFITRLNTSTSAHEYGHVVYITDIIRINGVIFAAIGLEAYPPFMRYRAFVNYDGYPFTDSTGLFSFYSSREIGTHYGTGSKYTRASRLDYYRYKTFRETYGYIDDVEPETTGVMCDRGSGSVYCINQSCEISVSKTITDQIDIYNGSTLVHSFDPTSITTEEKNYKLIDIAEYLSSAGSYTLKIGNKTVEHFTVASNQTVSCESIEGDDDNVKIVFSQTNATAIGVAGYYKDSAVNHTHSIGMNITDEEQEQGYCILPKVLGDNDCTFDYFDVLYRVSGGTFHILCYSWSDSLIDNPNPIIKQSSTITTVTPT